MIHYHGSPITPESAAASILEGRHAMISFAAPEQIALAASVCQSLALDNGAFSAWKKGAPISDWSPFYEWLEVWRRHPAFDFALMPDVIDGSEEDNDLLMEDCPFTDVEMVPVWHMHESIERLERIVTSWPRVALGSSGAYATVGTPLWWKRMAEVMECVCDRNGRPRARLHGLRMLDPDVFRHLPLASADSTNVARNIGMDSKWRGTYPPLSKAVRGLVLATRTEKFQSAERWVSPPYQSELPLGDFERLEAIHA